MLRFQHELAGLIIGFIFSLWLWNVHQSRQFVLILVAGCFLMSIWGANLPDLLDPPTSRYHRSIGHNFVSFFMFIFIAIVSLALVILLHGWLWFIIASFSFSYLSHLILDLSTKAGLPMFIGKSLLGIIEIPVFLLPILNYVMIIITIYQALKSINHLAKKIGGKLAMMVLFIPVWGALLLLGIALVTAVKVIWLHWIGYALLLMFSWCVTILIFVGHGIDIYLRKQLARNQLRGQNEA